MASSSQLSPRAAIGVGLAIGAVGTLIVLLGLGIVGELKPDDAPPWVVACAGFVFVLGGLAVIVGYAVASGVTPDGDFAPDTPFHVRAAQAVLGLGITVLLSVITTWVAFGEGSRQFTGTSTFGSAPVSEATGRLAWGAGAVLMWAFTAVLAGVSLKRLRRARRA